MTRWRILAICFNPRAPCGARPAVVKFVAAYKGFNPRAPCGARPMPSYLRRIRSEFQSTRPMRGATTLLEGFKDNTGFQSTRPMRGATASGGNLGGGSGFNPRAPCGARRREAGAGDNKLMFQSTRPMRGATLPITAQAGRYVVSIHAPHAGRDAENGVLHVSHDVSIHAPHAGRDDAHDQ